MEIEGETRARGDALRAREELKIKNLVSSLIDIQLSKLENKLAYLEEYEKLILYERNHLEVFQRFNVAETVKLAHKRTELNKHLALKRQETAALAAAAAAKAAAEAEAAAIAEAEAAAAALAIAEAEAAAAAAEAAETAEAAEVARAEAEAAAA
jgi:hypothetical protein